MLSTDAFSLVEEPIALLIETEVLTVVSATVPIKAAVLVAMLMDTMAHRCAYMGQDGRDGAEKRNSGHTPTSDGRCRSG